MLPEPDEKDAGLSEISFMFEPGDMEENSEEESFEAGYAPFILI
jgi:hypothetical protein